MANETTFYRWTKFKNGIGSVALVTLEVEQNSIGKNQIFEHYSGQGFTSQGYIEEVPEKGYDPWKLAAKKGLEYAFSLTKACWTVHINKIEGRLGTDTNSTIVGYTTLRAFLDKIDFQLPDHKIEALEEFVLKSWIKPYKELIPDFFNLIFTEFDWEKK